MSLIMRIFFVFSFTLSCIFAQNQTQNISDAPSDAAKIAMSLQKLGINCQMFRMLQLNPPIALHEIKKKMNIAREIIVLSEEIAELLKNKRVLISNRSLSILQTRYLSSEMKKRAEEYLHIKRNKFLANNRYERADFFRQVIQDGFNNLRNNYALAKFSLEAHEHMAVVYLSKKDTSLELKMLYMQLCFAAAQYSLRFLRPKKRAPREEVKIAGDFCDLQLSVIKFRKLKTLKKKIGTGFIKDIKDQFEKFKKRSKAHFGEKHDAYKAYMKEFDYLYALTGLDT